MSTRVTSIAAEVPPTVLALASPMTGTFGLTVRTSTFGTLEPARLLAAMVTLCSPMAVVTPDIRPEEAFTVSPVGRFVAVNAVGPLRAFMGWRMEGVAPVSPT